MTGIKPVILTVVILIGLGIGLIWFWSTREKPNEPTHVVTPTVTEKVAPSSPEISPIVSGQYLSYDAEKVKDLNGSIILFFHAPWCPQCRALDTDIKNGVVPENTTILKVDYDSNQALRQKYGVTLQTTLVKIDSDGNKIKSYVAYDEPTLANLLINLN